MSSAIDAVDVGEPKIDQVIAHTLAATQFGIFVVTAGQNTGQHDETKHEQPASERIRTD